METDTGEAPYEGPKEWIIDFSRVIASGESRIYPAPDDAEKERDDNGKYLTASDLTNRGWTASLIRDFLGAPDMTRPNPRYPSAAPMRLYSPDRVRAAENSEAWVAAKSRSAKRSNVAAKVAEQKRRELLAYVARISIEVPVVPKAELVRRALRGGGGDETYAARKIVNHLRHELTRYERELEIIYGKVGVRDAYEALNRKVYAAIAVAYPDLAAECARQLERKFGRDAEADVDAGAKPTP